MKRNGVDLSNRMKAFPVLPKEAQGGVLLKTPPTPSQLLQSAVLACRDIASWPDVSDSIEHYKAAYCIDPQVPNAIEANVIVTLAALSACQLALRTSIKQAVLLTMQPEPKPEEPTHD